MSSLQADPLPHDHGHRKITVRRVPYYCEANGEECARLFDPIILTPKEIFIDASKAALSPATLENKLVYGAKWLIENAMPTGRRQHYARFRADYVFRRSTRGVSIEYRKKSVYATNEYSMDKAVVELTPPAAVAWLDLFIAWLENAPAMEVYNSWERHGGKLTIAGADEMTLVRLCAQAGAELDIAEDKSGFKVAK